MKRIPIVATLIVGVMTLIGCKTRQTGPELAPCVHMESVKAIDMSPFVDSVRFVQLENDPESAFTDIDKLLVNGTNIFLLDKRLEAVFCFDTKGSFRYKIQHVGRGPGEYNELDGMWIKPGEQELWLHSFWPPKIMVYNFDGEMLREFATRWSARDLVWVGNHLLAGYNASRSNDGKDSLQEGVFLLDETGKSLGQAKAIGDSTMYWSVAYQRNLEEYDHGALVLCQSDTIYRIDENGLVTPDVYLDWGKKKYPDDRKGINYGSPRQQEALTGNYVCAKDQLLAFGPVRIFRAFIDGHLEMAMVDLSARKGYVSNQINSGNTQMPLLYPLGKSDRHEIIGIYDMSTILALKESQDNRQANLSNEKVFKNMDALVETALKTDRPVLWFAKIKDEWLTKI